MGRIAAVVSEPADLREFDCLLPDEASVGAVAARFAELARFPTVGPDGSSIAYAFVANGGCLVDPQATLADVDLPEPLRLRIVPELTIGAGDGDLFAGVDEEPGPEPIDVEIGEERCLAHDDGLDLRLEVRVQADAHQAIDDFASRDRYIECAGLLLGDIVIERKARVAVVRAIAPALGAIETRTSVKLTFEAWESMLRTRDEYSEMRVLGWFHTHAGWGVFLSEMDLFVQNSFFAHPNMVAYVADPTSSHESFFSWRDGRVVQNPTFGLVGAPEESPLPRKPLRIHTGAMVTCVAGLAIAGGLYMGWGGHREPPKQHPRSQVKAVVSKPVAAPKVAERLHVLGRRENLWTLCTRVYGDGDLAPALAKYNGIKDFSGLQIGQHIKLPPKEVLKKYAH